MPDGVMDALKAIRDKIGYHAFVFIVLSFVAGAFAKNLPTGTPASLQTGSEIIAGGLFAIGLLVGLLHLFVALFAHRPARGLIDGLAAGVLAGAVGGYFGFGWHTTPDYVELPFIRVALCVLFTTPVGGVLGLCFDLFQADRPIPWRTFLGVILLGLAFLVVVVIFGLLYFMTTMRGRGIIMSDLQLLFETFVAFSVSITSIEFSWPIDKFLARIPVFAASVLVERVATYLMPAMTPQTPDCSNLGCSEFVDSINGRSNFAVAVVLLMIWSVCTYVILVKDHRVNRLFTSLLGHHLAGTGY